MLLFKCICFTPITHERRRRQITPFHPPFILIIHSFVQTNNRDYFTVVFSFYYNDIVTQLACVIHGSEDKLAM